MKEQRGVFDECLNFLVMHGLKFKVNHHAERLRGLALSYVATLRDEFEPQAIFLTGSSIVGCSGKGSDIDIDVIVAGPSKPLQKRVFNEVPVDDETNFSRKGKYRNVLCKRLEISGLLSGISGMAIW